MQYMGGKAKQAKWIVGELESVRVDGQRFVDMFAGTWNIVSKMSARGPRVANDLCVPLVNMAKAWRDEWRPPIELSRERYHEIKFAMDYEDPMTAFAGFGLSYGGKWFGGYASNNRGDDFCGAATNAINRKLEACADVEFTNLDFRRFEVRPGDLVYSDAPYFGTTTFGFFQEPFPFDEYIEATKRWAALGATVVVSEYQQLCPSWIEIGARPNPNGTLNSSAVERLYKVQS